MVFLFYGILWTWQKLDFCDKTGGKYYGISKF